MHYRVLTVLVVALCTAAGLHAAADISGNWAAAINTQIGVQNYTFQFKVAGTKLTGRTKSDNGEYEIQDGRVEGDTVTFVENMRFRGGELKITYRGTIASAKEIKFTRNVADVSKEEFVARRTK
jgi:hypothetical protein